MFERFTDRARRVVVLAMEEARRLNHSHIGTEHVLLGLLREGKGVAAQVLVRESVDPARVRAQVLELVGGGGGEAVEAAARARLVRMTVPQDVRELEEQLVQVRRQGGTAIDAEDFDTAAALHHAEKQLLTRMAEREKEWAAGVDLAAVIAENHRLHDEVERLRGLLRQHGIEPNGGTARTG